MIDRDTLLRRMGDLRLSLANAILNIAQAEEDLDDARKAEQRVRGAITLLSELIDAPVLEVIEPEESN